MPTEPSARDREQARRVSPCRLPMRCRAAQTERGLWLAPVCPDCRRADAIARALAAREAEVREPYRRLLALLAQLQDADHDHAGTMDDDCHACLLYERVMQDAAAIRALGGGA